jgi:hypothetical protein
MDNDFQVELDERLPTGEWRGFYLDRRRTGRGWMQMYLQFTGGKIKGEGTDHVGPWHVRGIYDLDSGNCSWTKQYLGQHQVLYRGICGDQGIIGEWRIGASVTGSFHVWPAKYGNLTENYLETELENLSFWEFSNR